ncbi:DUF3795 domain-containing protein [Chloroflexota bacterium]
MKDPALAAICGIYCGDCGFLGERCAGCGNTQGKPFHVEQAGMDVCQLYGCCVNQHGLEHCGLCEDFPCQTFISLRDPSMSDEEFEESLRERQRVLSLRKEIGTEAWLREEQ